ncbi:MULTISPECIES: site-specific integrase [unclassified Sphingomonas]|uniref:tyrosine-type recombinase/integrase n=1 Tax=unclassified Sphingomonas TaxID=196159 RepID=UPI000E74C987|nr:MULTISPECIES: site-specific integrase [unclassified Sphingomonas]RKE45892.1 site-specific recombinase XerD [Sphingomonas sp. PP-CC-1A-547]TCM06840.1 site-specific recombinase XerD [Sphingomonas sp. PP-CC-3G-468]
MLSIRPRGKNGILYIRGQVSLGDKRIDVKEFSSGTCDADAASHLMAEYETKLRHQLLFGPAAAVAQGIMADAFDSYLSKAKSPCASDVLRVGKLNGLIGDLTLREPKQAWEHFRRAYLTGHDPAGQDRYRAVFQAAVNVHHEMHDLSPIKIKAIPFDNERVRFLTKEERDRLIGSYTPHVRPIITMLAFHGPRVQTALQIQWGANGVDMAREAIRLNHIKTAVIQSVPMHRRVRDVLGPIWEDRGRPTKGHVFLNKHGQPYQDTRLAPIPGGNPLKRAHATALGRAEIEDFTVHDWRHHWASHCVMAGIDLITIMHMGGWKSLRMVQRYASVGVEHMREAINKLS